ncbi:MAG: Gfo/Idh/MocA family protein [Candidatus Eiseniibacteriota bacterium]
MQRLRLAIIGTGFGHTVHSVAFRRHAGFELVAIAGSDEGKTRRIAGELGNVGAFTDWRRMLEDLRPDVVSIAAPPDLHGPMMVAAVEFGCHVLCEKPTALHRFQAAEMREAALSAGRVAAVNHEFRFFPARGYALALVRRGEIGVPRRGEILGRYPIWPRPESRGWTWLSDVRRGGGVLGALGSHHTDCFRLFFGEPVEAWASVRVDQPLRGPAPGPTARAGSPPDQHIATADDACTVHYTFAAGATAMFDLNATAPYRWERFEIHGSEGTLRWDETGYRLWRVGVGEEPRELEIPAEFRLEPRAGDPPLVAPFAVMVERLHCSVVGLAPMEPDFDDAVAVQSALDAARASSAAGARVRVDALVPARA